MLLSFPIVALGSQLVMTVADQPPNFDTARTCKVDLTAAFGQDSGERYKSCMQDEQAAHQQVQALWPKVPAPAREGCASQERIGDTPSFVSLLTCLQMSSMK
jgi:hypothetical protein